MIGSTIGSGIVNYSMGKIGTNVIYKVREEIFDNLQNMSMDYYDKSHSGDIISIATNDVDQLTLVFGGQLSLVIADAFKGLLIIILMLKEMSDNVSRYTKTFFVNANFLRVKVSALTNPVVSPGSMAKTVNECFMCTPLEVTDQVEND